MVSPRNSETGGAKQKVGEMAENDITSSSCRFSETQQRGWLEVNAQGNHRGFQQNRVNAWLRFYINCSDYYIEKGL